MEAIETLNDEEVFSKEYLLPIMKEKEYIDILFGLLNQRDDEESIVEVDDGQAQQENESYEKFVLTNVFECAHNQQVVDGKEEK